MAKSTKSTTEIELLKRYRAGKCTPEEIRRVDEWFDAHEQAEVPPILHSRSVLEINQAVMRSIRPYRQKHYSGFFFFKVAAMLLLTLMAGLFAYRELRPAKIPISYTTISTKQGERKTIILPDSSQISLNNESSVRFVSDFTGTTRSISLTGEAFFNVRHDKRRPFIVNTGKLHVQVLGTSFDVKAFPGESISKVTVASGKVSVYRKAGEPIRMLLPGDQLSYDNSLQNFTTMKVKAEDQYAWQNNVLIFKGEDLQEIARQLERWYGVKISISGDHLKKEQFNIKQNNESLSHVLESLSLSGDGFHYSIKDKQVFIW